MAVLGLRFCARAFSSCGERGPLFIAVCGPLTIAASLVAEHRLQTRRLSSCGSRAQLLRGMWDSPRPGLEPVSPALAGGFLTSAPPGKPKFSQVFYVQTKVCICWTKIVHLTVHTFSLSWILNTDKSSKWSHEGQDEELKFCFFVFITPMLTLFQNLLFKVSDE